MISTVRVDKVRSDPADRTLLRFQRNDFLHFRVIFTKTCLATKVSFQPYTHQLLGRSLPGTSCPAPWWAPWGASGPGPRAGGPAPCSGWPAAAPWARPCAGPPATPSRRRRPGNGPAPPLPAPRNRSASMPAIIYSLRIFFIQADGFNLNSSLYFYFYIFSPEF